MGCCTRFRRTWIPGYNSDVIDPDKAFDFERRVVIIKKLIVILALLALLIGLIYLVVYLVTSKSDNNSSSNQTPTVSSLASPDDTTIIKSGSVFSPLHSTSIENQLNSSTLVSSLPPSDTTTPPTDYKDHNSNSLTYSPTTVVIKNITHDQKQNSSNLLCSSSGNALECIALSKSFKTLITFPSTSNYIATKAEGYVMVKMENNVWHPYCYPHWTLQMGYKLCKGLGFKQFIQLQTIGISELKQRITQLGKDISLEPEGPSAQYPDLLVVTTENSTAPLKTNTSQFSCKVGHISCS